MANMSYLYTSMSHPSFRNLWLSCSGAVARSPAARLFTSSVRNWRDPYGPMNAKFTTETVQTSVPRNPTFARVSRAHVAYFQSLLGRHSVLTSAAHLSALNSDWMRRYVGHSELALRPSHVSQVSAILSYCNHNRLAVVPQGGNTGLVGGSVPVHDEIILNLSSLNKVESFDSHSGVVITQSGVVLDTLDKHVEQFGFRVPLDLGAKGTCQIGGNVATNAGGTRFIRYGSLKSSVLGLEIVLPNGQVMDLLSSLRKDNTGYDLKQLFIGSEGTLGVITKVALACPARKHAVHVVLLKIEHFQHVMNLLLIARNELSEILSAFEYFDNQSFILAMKSFQDRIPNPFPNEDFESHDNNGKGLILIECSSNDVEYNLQKLDSFIQKAQSESFISNSIIATSDKKRYNLWKLRESLAEAFLISSGKNATTLKYDVSLPLSSFHDCVHAARQLVHDIPNTNVASWGHVGDGNLHLNVSVEDGPNYGFEVTKRIEPWIYEFVRDHKGSISAEHGLGVMKSKAIGYSKSNVAIDVMRNIKHLFDPNGICNPYKMLP